MLTAQSNYRTIASFMKYSVSEAKGGPVHVLDV